MKLSRKFLDEYIDTQDISNEELAEKMTHVGNEYDSVEPLSPATNLVIGHIKECVMHPDSDHLHVCQVEIHPGEVTQIVCGAPNVAKNQKVIVSLVGAKLPGGIEIKKGNIRGQESNGVICSLSELGIDHKYQSEEDKKGIHILPEDAPVGENPLPYLGFDDATIDFELTSNRGDLLSILGMAYEVGAILNEKVKLPNLEVKNEVEDIKNYIKVDVKTDNCPLYLARMVKNVTIKESPNWLKARLIASGIRPINNVVDISNYVMLETGQPLHFFDYQTLGDTIVVRMAEENEKLITLDEKERILTKEDMVIANNDHAVALAGVMGGLNSEVENTTKDIVIESAIFNPVNIRLTSKRVLRSEASNRFEKGLDPLRTYMAINRACVLLEELAEGTVIKGTVAYDHVDKEPKVITITQEKINLVLGMNLSIEEIADCFKRLDFSVEIEESTFVVTVPTRRIDIRIKEDLIEEVGRIHGIEHVIGKLPVGTGRPGSYERDYIKEKEIRNRLLSMGLQQVRTYSLTSKEHLLEYTLEQFMPLELQDPMLEDRKYLRHSLIPSLYQVATYNMARNIKDIMIHEISNIYYKENDRVIEKKSLAGLITGNVTINNWQHLTIKADFYYLKGIVENLLNYMGFAHRIHFEVKEVPKEYHPYQSATIILDSEVIGYLGMIHPSISKVPVYVFELDLTKLFSIKVRPIKEKEVSKYPSISKDMAFVLDKNILSEEVMKTIQKTEGKLLSNVDVFDVYQGENIALDKKSIAFNLTFMDQNRTLTDDEVMEIFRKIITAVEEVHHGQLRDK